MTKPLEELMDRGPEAVVERDLTSAGSEPSVPREVVRPEIEIRHDRTLYGIDDFQADRLLGILRGEVAEHGNVFTKLSVALSWDETEHAAVFAAGDITDRGAILRVTADGWAVEGSDNRGGGTFTRDWRSEAADLFLRAAAIHIPVEPVSFWTRVKSALS